MSEFALKFSLWPHFSYPRDNDVCMIRCNVRFLYCVRVPIRYRSALCSMVIIDFIMCCFDQGLRCSYILPLIMLEINVIRLVDDLYS